MDEPCSALDPVATLRWRISCVGCPRQYTIVIVTHNMQQAARAPTIPAFSGWANWSNSTQRRASSAPKMPLTEAHITAAGDRENHDHAPTSNASSTN